MHSYIWGQCWQCICWWLWCRQWVSSWPGPYSLPPSGKRRCQSQCQPFFTLSLKSGCSWKLPSRIEIFMLDKQYHIILSIKPDISEDLCSSIINIQFWMKFFPYSVHYIQIEYWYMHIQIYRRSWRRIEMRVEVEVERFNFTSLWRGTSMWCKRARVHSTWRCSDVNNLIIPTSSWL